ncbi:DUF2058 domain-containing protein [Cocleimonas sp. KMM 6892]|uniref:DUF2058 domain-containing protein n=1 Tax=unclassified Cocleimonas TaxID=2639732 RepID=UPI002DBDABCA|nr:MULTISPECIES: DUF2058 domain-containing protein [unclassified Cocleimonas]MEB8431058.1 DUF2058 domain-containing protein [Cocleimonas sp. KMM 6892]MEC4714170.1 DUF2058 domain-containing protein [Cocleimonas sp. KMM 6895]MEC4743501.1 DUF2058 domain-containing protein [Cocleimonas sp. KMM 6896]
MKGSLQDQLLGAGLIKKQEAKNIQTAKKKAKKQSQATNTELKNDAAELAEKARLEEQKKSQALNEQRKQEAQQKEVQAQIRQMIQMNAITKLDKKAPEDSELTYNFTDNNKIKTMLVSAENHTLISRGIIAIAKIAKSANTDDSDQEQADYFLIPAEAARKISERDNESIVLLNEYASKDKAKDQSNTKDEDDPYADFEVPDDLMW